MDQTRTGTLIETLAGELQTIGRRAKCPILLYAEAGDNWAGGSIFLPQSAQIEFQAPSAHIFHIVEDLWDVAPNDKKWRGVTVFVEGDEFRAEFDYGEGWSPEEDEGDRREPIVRAHFGDKPIYYPPLEGAEPWR